MAEKRKMKESDEDDDRKQSLVTWIVQNHFWVFAIWVVPMSLVFDVFYYVCTRYNYFFSKASVKHAEKVKDVQKQVKEWMAGDQRTPMCTARPCWKSISLQTMTYKQRMFKVAIDMPDIISIDEERRIVRVEPMVSIGQLNDFLIQRGWTLPVVPELDDLTIGGLVMGGGIESTSHKYGLFQYICKAFEMVLSDASVVWTDKDTDPEFFAAIPFSYGTLGFLTAVDLDIIPYKPYIKLNYVPVYSFEETVDEFTRVTNDPAVDSVEGIMYTLDTGVIMNGTFVEADEVEADKINRMGRWYKPWFYKHVEKYLVSREKATEYIPTVDFYHRQNAAFFWLMPYIIPFANNVIFRYLFGWSMPPKFSLLKWLRKNLTPEEQNRNFVCQDFGYELAKLKESLTFVDEETKIYPLWLCPTRHVLPKEIEHLSLFRKEEVHVDVGIYGFSPIKDFDPIASQKRMERHAIDTGNYVALYAETQLTRADFDEMFEFNLRNYVALRKRMNCEKAFPHVYEKISKLGRT